MSQESDDLMAIEEIRELLEQRGGPVGLAARMNDGILEASGLDLRTFFLVRVAALAATAAGPSSWRITTELMDEDVDADEVLGVLAAIAPIIGTSRLLTAVENLMDS